MATHTSIPAWRIPWTEEPGGQQSACVHAKSFSRVRLFATPWTVARLAPLSMGFSRQEYWCGLPCPPPGALPNLGIKLICSISCISRWVLYH